MSGTTTNLGIQEIASNSNQKEVVANTAFDQLDRALTNDASISVAGGVDVTPSSSTVLFSASLTMTGLLTANISLILPTNQKWYRIKNSTTETAGSPPSNCTVTVKCSGQTGVVFNQGDQRLVYCNGNDIFFLESTFGLLASKGVASGYCPLDGSSRVPASSLPTRRSLRWRLLLTQARLAWLAHGPTAAGSCTSATRPTRGRELLTRAPPSNCFRTHT